MFPIDADVIYGKSLLYKEDPKRVQEVKEINNHLTIMHYLEEKNSKSYPHITEMSTILKKSFEKNRVDDV
tara:strand:- start:475 stop:684 length:210 start_codon:yes stop_codon:yes gene_type:complete